VKRLRATLGWVLVGALLLGGACGGGGGGSSGDSGGGDCAEPTLDVGGFWAVQETTSSQSCGSELNQFSVNILQNGSSLTFLGRTTFSATMCGSRASNNNPVSVPIVEGSPVPGIRTYSSLVLTFSSNSAFTGTGTWSQSAGGTSCSGTSTFAGTR